MLKLARYLVTMNRTNKIVSKLNIDNFETVKFVMFMIMNTKLTNDEICKEIEEMKLA